MRSVWLNEAGDHKSAESFNTHSFLVTICYMQATWTSIQLITEFENITFLKFCSLIKQPFRTSGWTRIVKTTGKNTKSKRALFLLSMKYNWKNKLIWCSFVLGPDLELDIKINIRIWFSFVTLTLTSVVIVMKSRKLQWSGHVRMRDM
jgi:hypothetical protein